jgi:hypothetical protein
VSRRTLARHQWLQCLLTVMALGVAGLCAGASAGHAATTTAFPATYNYDYPAKFAQRAFGSPLRQTGSSARRSQRLHGEGASFRVGRRAGVAAESAGARFVVDSAGETRTFVRAGDETLEVSQHAALRITQRGLTVDKVEAVVNDSQPFRYYHAGTWKTGYYDPGSRVFVGSSNGTITTVINDASSNYVNNLRAARP